MRQDLIEVRAKRELLKLRPVLVEWTNLVIQYSRSHDDACWWYNERATLSILAAAAWRKDWNALEEYSTRKAAIGDKTDPELHRAKTGRCDLYMAHGNHSYAIEAKQAWQPIGERVRSEKNGRTVQALDDAWADARELRRGEAGRRLALTFVVPSFPLSTLKGTRRECLQHSTALVERWSNDIKERFNWDAYAHVFPSRTRLLVPDHGKRVFPGVLALFQICRRGNGLRLAHSST